MYCPKFSSQIKIFLNLDEISFRRFVGTGKSVIGLNNPTLIPSLRKFTIASFAPQATEPKAIIQISASSSCHSSFSSISSVWALILLKRRFILYSTILPSSVGKPVSP